MHNQNWNGILWVGVLIAILIASAAFFRPHATTATQTGPTKGFGSAGVTVCNGGECTGYSAVDSDKGYWVNGTNVINSTFGANLATTTVEAFTEGGCVMATSTSAETNNLTFTAAEVQTCRLWVITPGRIFQTLTLAPSSSITTLIPNAGDVARIIVRNSTSTVGGEFRIASSTGTNFNPASTTPASVATTTPGDFALLTLIRRLDTDIDVLWSPFK